MQQPQLILPHKMANRFIPYVPKPTNEKHSSKSVCKNVPKQPSTVDSSLQIKRHSAPIRASAVTLTEICKSNGGEDEDNTYFPTVQELARQGVSIKHAPKAVDKPALDDDDNSINPNKSTSDLNSGNSQGISANPSS
jgi:hypothetical protein